MPRRPPPPPAPPSGPPPGPPAGAGPRRMDFKATAGPAFRRGRGFERTASLLQTRIREASESRGYVGAKLLAHWAEIVGPEIASRARPVKVGYSGKGLGATLTLLTTGPHAPVIEMQRERIREKVNAVYGFGAIARVRVTQTAPEGFADGQALFDPAPVEALSEPTDGDRARDGRAREIAAGVEDAGLREALEALARHVIKR